VGLKARARRTCMGEVHRTLRARACSNKKKKKEVLLEQ
jgi:hypothetical protein